MRKDAKKQLGENFMETLEKDENLEPLRNLHREWSTQVGTSKIRVGRFGWVQYKNTWEVRTGKREESGKRGATKKEFVDAMKAKGKDDAWAVREWDRRRSDSTGQWKSGVCKDTQLPTVQMWKAEEDRRPLSELGLRGVGFCVRGLTIQQTPPHALGINLPLGSGATVAAAAAAPFPRGGLAPGVSQGVC
jgi:hypothetical protein